MRSKREKKIEIAAFTVIAGQGRGSV